MPMTGHCVNCGKHSVWLIRMLCPTVTCYYNPKVRARTPAVRPVKLWTMKELIELQALHDDGYLLKEIAVMLGRTLNSVVQGSVKIKHKLNLPTRRQVGKRLP
jgi:hypothetical protein